MSLIKEGHNVKVHYKGTLTDGTEFDNSKNRGTPLEFEVGSGQVIKGFDSAVCGMGLGEVKTITLTPTDAYGDVNPDAIHEAPKTAFPPDFKFEVGTTVRGTAPTGEPLVAKILSETDQGVVLDHNHPLAGEDLTFEIEIIEYDNE
jgi:FKBP-type peptidyl-prolyl cis-trans isomerase 2